MKLLAAFGIHAREEARPVSPRVLPPARREAVALDEIVGLDAVFRALSYLQTLAGQLTIDAWRGTEPIASAVVARPDAWRTQRQWVIETVASLSLTGNAFWRIRRDKDSGAILNLDVLDASRVAVALDANRQAHYTIDGTEVPPTEIAHLRYLTIPGRALGLGPIQAARAGLTGMVRVARYADNLFTRGGTPSGILSTSQPLTREQAADAAAEWDEKQTAGKTAVLGHDLDYKPVGVKPSELQWLDSQKWSVVRVARLFGIPPAKLAVAIEGASLTYNNIEQATLDMLRDTLMGYLAPIEDMLTWLLPRGQSVRFNLDAVLRPDTKTRYEAHEIGLRAGFLTVDEVRGIEGLTPLTTAPAQEAAQ